MHDQTDVDTAVPLVARAAVTDTSPLFADLRVRRETVDALAAVGITRAFAIQEYAIPIALAGGDVIGQARTGTGKTLGFGVPLLERVRGPQEGAPGVPQALVLVPTRELCLQVTKDIATAGRQRHVRTLAVYGGRAYEPQVEALRKGVDVVIGTPGRLIDLMTQRHLRLDRIAQLVLDEADEMLDLGFLPDIERILAALPVDRQTMLFSATMPGPIVTLARRFLRQPTLVRAEDPHDSHLVPTTRQLVYRTHQLDKPEVLARVLQAGERGLTIVFSRTKRSAQRIADDLVDRGFAAAAVHGDLGQGAREQAMRAFRAGKVDILVATDVAARGLDVDSVTHVVNYECPEDEKVYLHRTGRTGRAGASGTAVTFVDWDDLTRWRSINDALGLPFHDLLETYSTSEHLSSDLAIPAGTSGILPRSQRTRAGLAAEELEDVGETGRARSTRRRPSGAGGGRHGQRTRKRTRGGLPVPTSPAGEEPTPGTTAPAQSVEPASGTNAASRPAAGPPEVGPPLAGPPLAGPPLAGPGGERRGRDRRRRRSRARRPAREASSTAVDDLTAAVREADAS